MKNIFLYTVVLFATIIIDVSGQINPINNKIAMDVSTMPENTSFGYDSCFQLGRESGMSQVGMYQNWTAVEIAPHTFNMTIFDIANWYYPAKNIALDLTITPIHTNNLEVPSDLVSMPLDNPIVISRFKILLDSIKKHIPSITLSSIVIGSEHDIYFGSDALKWAQFTVFYDSVSKYARKIWPGLKIATELKLEGLIAYNNDAQKLNALSDYVGVSYYPLNNDFTVQPVSVLQKDFAGLVALYPSKPICFYQFGYPTSPTCKSSEDQQMDFIKQAFALWDQYHSNIRMIDFTWLHDLSPADVNYYKSYYGVSDTIFLEFIHTLGLRSWKENGTDKKGFAEFQCQAKKRGYNNLDINCRFTLNLTKGTGGGYYLESSNHTVAAAVAPQGKLFDKWIGDVQYLKNETDSLNEITMPARDINIEATYRDKPNILKPLNARISIYPNPACNRVNIEFPTFISGKIRLIQSSGLIALEQEINSDKIALDLTNMPSGIYIVQVISDFYTSTQTIVIEKK